MRGSRFGDRYRVIAPLAEGGMGRVWLAEDERTGDPLVIKQVRAPDDLRLRRLFGRAEDPQNEARTVYNMARRYSARDPARAAALGQRALHLLETLGLPYADEVARWLDTLDDDTPASARTEAVRAWYHAWGASAPDADAP